ncbi:MAG: flagellar biosynthesis regulator FlaF [Hyphomicrobiales bacterium]
MQNRAAQTYGRTAQNTINPRDLEARLLIKAAMKLQAHKDNWEGLSQDLRDALHFNRQLWTIFTTSVTREDRDMPVLLKQNIVNLGLFIFNQTISLLHEPDVAKLNALISINREIAAGLRGNG